MPSLRDGIPDFGTVARVYRDSGDILFRTWWELKDASHFDVPASLELWIERVYGESGTPIAADALREQLVRETQEAEEKRNADWNEAERRLLFDPERTAGTDQFGSVYSDLVEDEGGEIHQSLVAQTRLAEPSTDVVCLWERDGNLYFDQEGSKVASLNPSSHAELRELLEHSVKIELRRLRGLGECVSQPAEWRKRGVLRFKHLLRLGALSIALGVELDGELGMRLRMA